MKRSLTTILTENQIMKPDVQPMNHRLAESRPRLDASLVQQILPFFLDQSKTKDQDQQQGQSKDQAETVPVQNQESVSVKESTKSWSDSKVRQQYKGQEFIPDHLIPSLIKYSFPSGKRLAIYSPTHLIIKVKLKDVLVDTLVHNWLYNRPPDLTRCADIARYIGHSKKPVDTMLYLAYNNVSEQFDVLDGIHRLTALRMIQENPGAFISGTHGSGISSSGSAEKEKEVKTFMDGLLNQFMIINLHVNVTTGNLIEVFKNLNKAQSVPDLYLRGHLTSRREIIDSIANEWMVKYSRHFTASINPNIGNTNRNRFVSLLDDLYTKCHVDETKVNDFKQVLDAANEQVRNQLPKKASLDAKVKARQTGCYLFLLKDHAIQDMIEGMI